MLLPETDKTHQGAAKIAEVLDLIFRVYRHPKAFVLRDDFQAIADAASAAANAAAGAAVDVVASPVLAPVGSAASAQSAAEAAATATETAAAAALTLHQSAMDAAGTIKGTLSVDEGEKEKEEYLSAVRRFRV